MQIANRWLIKDEQFYGLKIVCFCCAVKMQKACHLLQERSLVLKNYDQ
jgi:hypothetical protein